MCSVRYAAKGKLCVQECQNAFFMASRPLVSSCASSFHSFHFHFPFLLSAPCIPHPVHKTTSIVLLHQSSNPYFPNMMQQFFSHNLLFLDYPEFGSNRLFLNISNSLRLTCCYNHTSTLTLDVHQALLGNCPTRCY